MTSQPKARRRALRGAVPSDFEAFYRHHLRHHVGSRVRSMELAQRYRAWVKASGGQSLSLPAIRRAMENIGHQHLRSNGVWYGDAQFADLVPHVPDNFPGAPRPPAGGVALELITRIDAMAAELSAMRAIAVGGGLERPPGQPGVGG